MEEVLREDRPVRLGIIGCGAIVLAQHAPALRRAAGAGSGCPGRPPNPEGVTDFEVVALADPSLDSAADVAAVWLGLPFDRLGHGHRRAPAVSRFLESRHHPDHRSLLTRGDLDAVLVATPNHTHAAISSDALAAGVHVFCEKPVAFTVEEHEELRLKAEAAHRCFQVGLVFRYSEVFRHTAGLLARPELGPPLMMLINEFRPFAHRPWRYSRAMSGGTLIEKNCHHFDLFNWMLGDRVRALRVSAMGGQGVLEAEAKDCWCLYEKKRLPPSDVIDHAFVLIEFSNGTKAQLGMTYFCPWGREFRVGLIGEDWKIDVYEMDRLIYVHRDAESKWQRFPPDESGKKWQEETHFEEEGATHTGALRQWEDFARCVRGEASPWCDLEKAAESVRIAVAADTAIREGRVVELG